MTDDDRPTVSIVTPAYNAAQYLGDLLRSVEAQDYPSTEHIVIDDGSNDDGATIRLLQHHPNVKWWSRENRGQYPTLNEGFRAATGEFVTTISADDTYADSGAIGAIARFLTGHPEYDAAYGYTRHLAEDGTPLPVQPYQGYPPWMLRYNLGCILHCSLLVRRERLIRDGLLFDESLRYIADAEWMARLYVKGYRFGRIERYVGAYRHHGSQVSTIATADESEAARRREEHAKVRRELQSNPVVRRLVGAYDTFHQRRVKALGAWRDGGGVGVWNVTCDWIRRRYGRE
jgi:glycosyltransferase involved in cell wall biosynthesis